MKFVYFFLLITLSALSYAAAPDDIATNQRGWFDATDINADNDYTNNPANNTQVSLWNDKSGTGNHLSQSGTAQPLYLTDNLSAERNGLLFDGIDDELIDANDIWTGTVYHSESFVVATTDLFQNSSLFASTDSHNNRLSTHAPWGNGKTYFDQGKCCGNPARLSGNIGVSLNQPYLWYFPGLPDFQGVFQDGVLQLSDSGAGSYDVTTASVFSLGGWPQPVANGHIHNGRYFEAIFYQTTLNDAQRSILHNYLSAKWDRTLGLSSGYIDRYQGDLAANGNYDFFVGGIGQNNGTQTFATSQGLTITDNNFLTDEGKFIMAGVNYLTTMPITGTSTTDLPSGYTMRSNRSWYIDRTGDSGLVNLSFDAAGIGIPVEEGATYALLHRPGISGAFTVVDTATMASGILDFSHLPDDGVYAIGKSGSIALSLEKTSQIVSDPVNLTANPKSIPGSQTDYTLTVRNTGDGSPDMDATTIRDLIPDELTLFTGDLDGSGSPFVFTDNNCPPTTNTLSSNLTLDYPTNVIFKDAAGDALTPVTDYDSAVRSFEITLSGTMNASSAGMIPCFTIRYRTQLE